MDYEAKKEHLLLEYSKEQLVEHIIAMDLYLDDLRADIKKLDNKVFVKKLVF